MIELEPVVERAPEFRGWRIRSKDQLPGTGTVVTDNWLQQFGFTKPTKFNIEKIIAATIANAHGYILERADLAREVRQFGDPFKGSGSADDIELGEGIGRIK